MTHFVDFWRVEFGDVNPGYPQVFVRIIGTEDFDNSAEAITRAIECREDGYATRLTHWTAVKGNIRQSDEPQTK